MPELAVVRKNVLQRLLAAGIDGQEAQYEVTLILEHVTGYSLARQHVMSDQLLDEPELQAIELIVADRERRRPLQYCLGYAWFRGLKFLVQPGVLIPRPDTEVLVETALHMLEAVEQPVFADIGCGSGAIAIAILKARSDARVVAVDISPTAVDVTIRNAEFHGVRDRLSVELSDWLSYLPNRRVHALISNPPYIPRSGSAELQPEVAVFEPDEALFGSDEDGLGFFRLLNENAGRFLQAPGFIAVEVGQGQCEAVAAIFEGGPWTSVLSHYDLNGIKRVVSAFWADRHI